MDKTTIVGWGGLLLGLYLLWGVLQMLVGYDKKKGEFNWTTFIGAWLAIALIFIGIPYFFS